MSDSQASDIWTVLSPGECPYCCPSAPWPASVFIPSAPSSLMPGHFSSSSRRPFHTFPQQVTVFTTQDISTRGHSTHSFDMSYSIPFRTFPHVATLHFLSPCHSLYHLANMFCEFFKLHLSIFMAGDKLSDTGPANQMQDSRSNPPAPEQNKPILCFLFL